mmetsp:Transcript_32709/g.56929  ORF Transcript_32709/g.56929 Transcript_32709/m.56929 type:complete len:108 (-) Transcript_32709:2510-2833(-)
MGVRDIHSDTEYIAAIANAGDSLVVVEFSAIWTPASTSISNFLDNFAGEFPEVVFLRLDIDRSADLFHKYHVSTVPSTKFLRHGVEIAQVVGAHADIIHDLLTQLYH